MMGPRARKRFYLGFALVCVLLFCGGILAGYLSRHDVICSDHKPPTAQLDQGFGYVQYKCQNGQVVTK
jgi:hypothetical protein